MGKNIMLSLALYLRFSLYSHDVGSIYLCIHMHVCQKSGANKDRENSQTLH